MTESKKTIRRFNCVGDDVEMIEVPDGVYVLLTDFSEQVCDVMDGLRNEVGDCWCVHFGSEHHTEECESAQSLFKQLSAKG